MIISHEIFSKLWNIFLKLFLYLYSVCGSFQISVFSSATSIALPSVVRNLDLKRWSAAVPAEEEVGTDQGLYNAGLFEGDIQLQPTVGVINEIPI